MRITRMKFKNFKQIASADMRIRPGILGLLGANGSGKSSTMQGLYYALTGNPLGDDRKQDLLKWDESSGQTIVWFDHDGCSYELRRAIHSSKAVLSRDDVRIKERKDDIDQFMGSLMKLRPCLYDKVVFLTHEDLDGIMRCAHAKRQEFFNQLFEVDRCEALRELLQRRVQRLPTYVDNSDRMKELSAEIDKGVKDKEALTSTVNAITDTLDKLDVNRDELVVKLSLPSEADVKTASAKRLADIQRERAKLVASIQRIENTPEPLEISEQDRLKAGMYTRVIRLTNDLKAATEAVEKASENVSNSDRAEMESNIVKHKVGISSMKRSLALAKQGKCPTCGHDYDGASAVELSGHLEKAESKLINMEKELNALGVFEKAVNTESSVKAALAALNPPSDIMSFDMTAYEDLLSKVSAQPVSHSAWEAERASLSGLRSHLNSLDKMTEDTVEEQAFITEDERTAVSTLLKEFDEHTSKKTVLLQQITGIDVATSHMERELERLVKEANSAADVIEKRAIMEKAREVLHRDVIPGLRTRSGLQVINDRMAEWLKVFQVDFSVRINQDTDFEAIIDGRVRPFKALSTGQKRSAAVAFRLTISELFAGEIGLLSLDEPAACLDDRVKEGLVDALEKASVRAVSLGMTIIVSTNEQSLVRSFNTTVDVEEKENEK